MKRKLNFIDKVRIVYLWLREHKFYGLISCCHYCNSTKIKRENPVEAGDIYTATYVCTECGASANIIENWRRKEEKTR